MPVQAASDNRITVFIFILVMAGNFSKTAYPEATPSTHAYPHTALAVNGYYALTRTKTF